MSDVIGLDWLRMFSSKELSTLIAGAEHEINVADLRVRYLKYLLYKLSYKYCLMFRPTPTTLAATS